MNQSYWQKTSKKRIGKAIQTDISTDIVIIGGGLSGVALAYQLRESPYQVIVLDKDEMGSHTSGHTTAKVTVLHGTLYQDIVEHYDIHQAYLYYQANQKALLEIRDIIRREKIACDFQDNTSYIYTDDPGYISTIDNIERIFQTLRVETVKDNQHLASIGLKDQAIFHPLKYLYALIQICEKKGISFYEHSQVTKIERKDDSFLLNVNEHRIQCKYLIHATRYPFIKKGFYFLKLFQEKEYIDYCDEERGLNSYLCIDQTDSYRPLYHDDSLIIHRDAKDWFAQDSIPLRGIPYIGRLNKYSNEFIIYGFQKWGMTLSQVAARLISDLIMEEVNPYEELFSCYYFSMSFSKKYTAKMWEGTKRGMITNHFLNRRLDCLEKQNGMITKVNGKLTAVYKDKKGNLHYFSPYCPHLKCIVEFNQKDQTWRCPCHQSVYNAYGQLMEGPSLYPLKPKDQNRE